MVVPVALNSSTSGQHSVFSTAVILRADLPDWVDGENWHFSSGLIISIPTFTFSIPAPSWEKDQSKAFSPGTVYYLAHWSQNTSTGHGFWVTCAIAASLSASPSRKILTLSIFTGTVRPLHSTSLMVAACFARVWVISACRKRTDWTYELEFSGIQNWTFQTHSSLSYFETKGFLKCVFPQSPGLLVLLQDFLPRDIAA